MNLVVLILLYFLSKGKYEDIFNQLDEKIYPLKRFLGMGHYLMKQIDYQYNTGYDQRMILLFNQIHGGKEGREYIEVHWANQVTLTLLVVLLFAFFAVILEEISTEFIFFSILAIVGVIFALNNEVQQQFKKRQLEIKLDFTVFLSRLILLMNAGLNVSKAWERIVAEQVRDRPLYKELRVTIHEIRNGKSEEEAYEDFANRCRNPEIFKFVSLIIQNLKKGNEETISMLRLLTTECWESRKNTAKVLGEEASTKLLIPMMIMFAAILLIVMTPAVLALRMM
ncbi:type II secretion system F family protein [Alkaliphilus hydrothermalis]|nr:type II secretion system F family protein [Alkaliphilus hydrothermalis]